MSDPQAIRDALRPFLVAATTPAQQRALAATLTALADALVQRAEAHQRQQARSPAQRVTPRSRKAGPGRAPGHSITIATQERPAGHGDIPRLRVVIGRGLWYDLARTITNPAIADAQRLAVRWNRTTGAVWFEPCAEGDGYKVSIGRGSPRFFADAFRDQLPPEGRYRGVVQDGAIWFADALPKGFPGVII